METRIKDADYLRTGVVTDEVLMELCRAYLPEIQAGRADLVPELTIRYVKKNNAFGYTGLENCFYHNGAFFVWEQDKEWEDPRYQEIAQDVFHDRCEGRGYAHKFIFAGVNTHFRDAQGEEMFTGDIIRVDDGKSAPEEMALGAFPGDYCFLLDNHYWELRECIKDNTLTRIGTVFYRLNPEENPPALLRYRTLGFNLERCTPEEHRQRLLMARYTPNFSPDLWMYQGLEVLGAEYHWNH
jgi:hypothetical protein